MHVQVFYIEVDGFWLHHVLYKSMWHITAIYNTNMSNKLQIKWMTEITSEKNSAHKEMNQIERIAKQDRWIWMHFWHLTKCFTFNAVDVAVQYHLLNWKQKKR